MICRSSGGMGSARKLALRAPSVLLALSMRMLMLMRCAPGHFRGISRGRPVNVVTNTFKVSRQPDFMIQQYDVSAA